MAALGWILNLGFAGAEPIAPTLAANKQRTMIVDFDQRTTVMCIDARRMVINPEQRVMRIK